MQNAKLLKLSFLFVSILLVNFAFADSSHGNTDKEISILWLV